ncbi:MAG TPA: M2 family metallopeptidase [Myxococcales bacterium]|nr:M2 family metallopeptidase [Myxococcales bacterium]
MKTACPLLLLALCACEHQSPAVVKPAEAAKPTASDARAFVTKVNQDLARLMPEASTAAWINNTYITDDTERNAASASERLFSYSSEAAKTARQFDGIADDADTQRMLYLMRVNSPIIDSQKERSEFTVLQTRMSSFYGKARDSQGRDLEQLEQIVDKSRDYAALLDAWTSWHDTAKPQRKDYARFVELQNQGARGAGYANMGDMWRSHYDLPAESFEKETDKLWQQVKPLYDDLHCYVRGKLQQQYGKEKVPDGKPIPAHLLGNMWAQEWTNIYPLVEPYKNAASLDVEGAMTAQKWTPIRTVKTAEAFYVSLGLDPLPDTFWKRSMLEKPAGRDVICHASAWDVLWANDLRIKMCIPTPAREEDLETAHHELGHLYYDHAYYQKPILYQRGANDGFHEAIGDSLVLSMTPGYLKQLGLAGAVPHDDKALIDVQMKDALAKIAFLPFGKVIDQWRWDVFSGKIAPADYNKTWWALREKYQGIAPGVARDESDFDPAAKFHIAANVSYIRYFLARILQFQFYRSMCQAAGHKGPLHECNFYGSKEAGAKLWKMLSYGASKPWPEALEAMTGTRDMDASALVEYFAPLQSWLKEQNKGRQCGW